MTIRLKVTLNEDTTPWTVVVDQKNNVNHVGHYSKSQKIAWHLQGKAAGGTFVDFHWLNDQPSPGIFRKLRGMYTDRLSIKDHNYDGDTMGEWIYQLSIYVNGKTYCTVAKPLPANTSNPMIKNK